MASYRTRVFESILKVAIRSAWRADIVSVPRIWRRARAVGVQVQDRVWDGMPHVFQAFLFIPEALEARRRACQVLRSHTTTTPASAAWPRDASSDWEPGGDTAPQIDRSAR